MKGKNILFRHYRLKSIYYIIRVILKFGNVIHSIYSIQNIFMQQNNLFSSLNLYPGWRMILLQLFLPTACMNFWHMVSSRKSCTYMVLSHQHLEITWSWVQKVKKKNKTRLYIDLTTPSNDDFISSIFFINKLLHQAVPICYIHVLNFYLLFNLSNLVFIHVTPLKILSHRLPIGSVLLIFQECRCCFWFFCVLSVDC